MAAKDPYRYFRVEARDLLRQMSDAVLQAEQGPGPDLPPPDLPARMLRLAHTLKGAASVVRQPGIAAQAHAIEDLLTPLRDSGAEASREDLDALLALIDAATQAVATLDPAATPSPSPSTAPASTTAAVASAPTSAATPIAPPIIETALPPAPIAEPPGALLEIPQVIPEEIDAVTANIAQTQAQVAVLQRATALLAELRAAPPSGVEELTGRLARIEDQLERATRALGHGLVHLRDSAEQLRLLPASLLFGPLQRIARDAGRAAGKQLTFHGLGGQVKLEGSLLNLVLGALVQMIRNAVAHGIETPEARAAAGKPAVGRIELSVERQGRQVLFRCRDDGAGVDLDAVRRKAVDKGVPGADFLDEAGLIDLLLRGGLSTARQVDTLAGRGVGLDLVRDTALRLGGTLTLRHERGRGTTLDLLLPLQLAALRALSVRAGGRWAWIPLEAVEQVLQRPRLEGQHVALGDELLPHLSLAEVLMPGQPAAAPRSALVLRCGERRAALGVEALDGVASVVLRPPPALLPQSPLIAGLALDAEQQPVPVLAPEGLVTAARQARHTPAPQPRPVDTILVIDDSLTTRMLEQSILEAAGYRVHMAANAADGIEAARRGSYAMILVDVEMPPGKSGFEFIEELRADPAVAHIPAVLVSSRNAPEDLARGKAVGANGYIVKSEFAQNEFLLLVARLVTQSRVRAQQQTVPT